MTEQPRWLATITYRTDNGSVSSDVDLVELADIEEYVDRGPHWDAIEKIEIIRVNHCDSSSLTVEQAERL